jgi:hypothetical protein
MTDIMGEVTRAVSAGLLFALIVWPSTGSTTPARLAFHGVDRIMPGTSTLLPDGGRIISPFDG